MSTSDTSYHIQCSSTITNIFDSDENETWNSQNAKHHTGNLEKGPPLHSKKYNDVKEYCIEKEVGPGPFHEIIKCIWRNVAVP